MSDIRILSNIDVAQMERKNSDLKDKISIAQDSLNRIIGFVNACDTKTAIMFAILGIFVTAFTANPFFCMIQKLKIIVADTNSFKIAVMVVLFFLSIGIFIWGLFSFVLVLFARVKPSGHDSKIYFGDIVYENEYEKGFKSMEDEEFLEDLLHQIIINSQICVKKYKLFNQGLILSSIGIGLFSILLVCENMICC